MGVLGAVGGPVRAGEGGGWEVTLVAPTGGGATVLVGELAVTRAAGAVTRAGSDEGPARGPRMPRRQQPSMVGLGC